MPARGAKFVFWTVVAMILVEVLTPGTDDAYELGPVDAVLALAWVLFFLRWFLRGGTVTVDYTERVVRWQRPWRGGTTVWPFSEISRATARDGVSGGEVALEIGNSRVCFKVPLGAGTGLATLLSSERGQ